MFLQILVVTFGACGVHALDDNGLLQRHQSDVRAMKSQSSDELEADVDGFGWTSSTPPRPWQPGKLPYVIDSAFPEDAKSDLLDRLQEFNDMNVGIQFEETNGPVALTFYHMEKFKGGMCICHLHPLPHMRWCEMGCIKGSRYPLWEKGAVNSALALVLGMMHEHQRSDRDDYVSIDRPCILRSRRHYFNVIGWYDKNNGPYDPFSITHPTPSHHNQCWNRYGRPIIRLKDPASVGADHDEDYGPRRGEFSELDKEYLKYLYGSGDTP